MLLHAFSPAGQMDGDNESKILGVCRAVRYKEYQFPNNRTENCSALNSLPPTQECYVS